MVRIDARYATVRPMGSKLAIGFILLLVGAAGCGGGSSARAGSGSAGGGIVSCTLTERVGTAGLMTCEEGSGSLRAAFQAACAPLTDASLPDAGISIGRHFADAPCSRVGALGGCMVVSSGVSQTIWYYASVGFTSADIQQLCAGIGAAFIQP